MNQHEKHCIMVAPKNTLGWHLRPVRLLVEVANRFESEIAVKFGQRIADAKSHLGILALGAGKGTRLYVTARGRDAHKAIKEIKKKLSSDSGNAESSNSPTPRQDSILEKNQAAPKGQISTTFKCEVNPDTKKVFLVGDFNDWDPQATPMTKRGSQFTKSMKLAPGKHEYKFIIDGEWYADPSAPVVLSELGSTNNVINI